MSSCIREQRMDENDTKSRRICYSTNKPIAYAQTALNGALLLIMHVSILEVGSLDSTLEPFIYVYQSNGYSANDGKSFVAS